MAGRVIPFVPPAHVEPSQFLRIARERCGLSPREFAPLLGQAIGRPDLTAGLRAWEDGAVRPPRAILEAAAAIARQASPTRPTPRPSCGRSSLRASPPCRKA